VRLQDDVSLKGALKALEEQTGNTIVDRRSRRTDPRLQLRLNDVVFWQALDEIVRQAGCGYSVYQDDGKLALVDNPLRQTRVHYEGIFRASVKRVAVVRDEDTGSHFCTATLELTWEPRFRPFLLQVGPTEATFSGGTRAKSQGQADVLVTGRLAADVDVRLPAPPRSSAQIASLRGQFALLGPSKMLAFEFAGLKAGQPLSETKEGVQVSVTPLTPQPGRWSYRVVVQNPPGGPRLESFREDIWLGNNEIALQKKQGSATITPLPSAREEEEISAKGARIRYDFTRNLPASPSGWSLIYRTPARLVHVPASFTLTDIALP
jgi:hypothetical protein